MANVKQTKAFMRAEIEDAHLSIVSQFKELRDTARVFKRVTKESTAAHEEQVMHLANGQLSKMVAAFNGVDKGVELLYAECERIFFAVTAERRRALHDAGRPLKYLLRSVLERYKATPTDGALVLRAFWVPAASLAAYLATWRVDTARWKPTTNVIDQVFEEAKAYEDELRKFKVNLMRYVSSQQFTGIITRERLSEKWNIGNGEREGEDAVAEAEAQIADGLDGGDGDGSGALISNKIEYDDDAAALSKTKKVLTREGERELEAIMRREARDFINTGAKKRRRTNGGGGGGEDNDDEEEAAADNADEDDAGEAPEEDLLVPALVSKRGGKNLRRRTRTQIEVLAAQAKGVSMGDDDDDSAQESDDGDGEVDEPSVSGDSEGVGDFLPEKSEDSDAASEDADEASHASSDPADGDEEDGSEQDDEADADDGGDEDDESDEKPARSKPPPAKKAKVTPAAASTAVSNGASARKPSSAVVKHAQPTVVPVDDDETTASETRPSAAVAAVPTVHGAPVDDDPFADVQL